MSQKDLARRTALEIAFDGVDITGSMAPYLLSVTYIDNEEDVADDLQIKLQDRDGIWMEKWLASAVDASAVATGQGGDSGGGSSSYIVTPKSGLNVRTGPSTSYKKLGALVCGTVIEVSGIENGWASIQYSGQKAYVSAQYIKKSDPATSSTASNGAVYVVVKGDTLSGIAAKYGTTYQALAEANGISNPNLIYPGQEIKIPGAGDGSVSSSGMKIQAVIIRKNWNGDGKDKVLECGQFELDDVSASGPPAVVTIKATSLPYTSQIRQTEKSRAWENIKLSGIAKQMASENGMTCLFESANDPLYERVEQFKVSDIAFLSSLCHDAGISLKATNNLAVLFDQAAYEAKPSVRTIRRGDGTYVKYKLGIGSTDTKYSSCRVRYTDPGTGKVIEATAYADDYKADAKSNQQLEVTAKVSSIAEAQALAAKRLRLHNKYDKSATFTMPGDPDLVAGVTVELSGWGPWSGKYIIKQARHTVGSNGYEVQVTLRRVVEGY